MNCSFKRLEFITEHRNVENPSLASLRIIWLKYCSLDSWTRFIHLLEKKLSKLSPCDDDIYWLHAPDAYKSNLLRNTLYCRIGSNQIINSVSILIWFYSGFLAGEEQHHLPQNHSSFLWKLEPARLKPLPFSSWRISGSRGEMQTGFRFNLTPVKEPLGFVKVVEWVRKSKSVERVFKLYFIKRAKAWLKTHLQQCFIPWKV